MPVDSRPPASRVDARAQYGPAGRYAAENAYQRATADVRRATPKPAFGGGWTSDQLGHRRGIARAKTSLGHPENDRGCSHAPSVIVSR